MSKMETLKDLLIEGIVSKQDLRAMAAEVFDGGVILERPDGYIVELPRFEDLDDRAQSYVLKVMLESTVTTGLFKESTVEEAHDPFPTEDVT